MQLSTELQAITDQRLVKCEVVRGFSLGGDLVAHPGEIVHLAAPLANQFSQEGSVRVRRSKAGAIETVANADYKEPEPPKTARIRVLRANQFYVVGEPKRRWCARGDVIEVKETHAAVACSGGNPEAERVA